MHISEMQLQAWQNSENKGFHKKDNELAAHGGRPYVIATKLMLIVSELAEALEEMRSDKNLLYYREDGKPEGLAAELADAVIRIADMSEIFGVNLEEAVKIKMAYNKSREYMHGGKKI